MTGEPRRIECEEAVEHLYEFLDRELTPPAIAEIEQHLEDCAGCFRHFEFERVFLQFLEARGRARGVPERVKRRIIRELFQAGGE